MADERMTAERRAEIERQIAEELEDSAGDDVILMSLACAIDLRDELAAVEAERDAAEAEVDRTLRLLETEVTQVRQRIRVVEAERDALRVALLKTRRGLRYMYQTDLSPDSRFRQMADAISEALAKLGGEAHADV